MPFALIFAGLILVTAGVRGKSQELYTLVKGDVETGYIYWMFSILVLGALGYIEELKPFSRALMALVIVVLFLKAGNPSGIGGGFFSQLNQGLAANPGPGNSPVVDTPINIGGLTGQFHGTQGDLNNWYQQNGIELPLASARPN
jgi:hypothetical protein